MLDECLFRRRRRLKHNHKFRLAHEYEIQMELRHLANQLPHVQTSFEMSLHEGTDGPLKMKRVAPFFAFFQIAWQVPQGEGGHISREQHKGTRFSRDNLASTSRSLFLPPPSLPPHHHPPSNHQFFFWSPLFCLILWAITQLPSPRSFKNILKRIIAPCLSSDARWKRSRSQLATLSKFQRNHHINISTHNNE